MEQHDDDKPVGRVLSRREMMKLLGGSGAVLCAGLTLPNIIKAQRSTAHLPQPHCQPVLFNRS